MKVRSSVKARSSSKEKKTKYTTKKQTITQITTKKDKKKDGAQLWTEPFCRRAMLFIKFEWQSPQTFKHFFPNLMFN